MNKAVKINSPAKINLLLDIIKLLPNGYHSLFMVMQSVSLYDTVEVQLNGSGKIVLECSETALPCDERNLAYRAAKVFFAETSLGFGCEIKVEKRIPLQAGLAGGSADAAGVLKALNELCKTQLSDERLCEIGVTLGADVPFCIRGGTMLAQDIGQVLSPLPKLRACFIVLAKPKHGVSTKEAYGAFDACENVFHPDCCGMLHALANSDFEGTVARAGNVFEQFVEVPERVEIKATMRESGSLCCCMSGSGPTVFGIFDSEENAKSCADKLRKKFEQVFVTKPV